MQSSHGNWINNWRKIRLTVRYFERVAYPLTILSKGAFVFNNLILIFCVFISKVKNLISSYVVFFSHISQFRAHFCCCRLVIYSCAPSYKSFYNCSLCYSCTRNRMKISVYRFCATFSILMPFTYSTLSMLIPSAFHFIIMNLNNRRCVTIRYVDWYMGEIFNS